VIRPLGDGYELDDDKSRIDLAEVHRYLCDESYWAKGRPLEVQRELVETAARVVGLYKDGRQVGFCRAATTVGLGFVYLADVYVLPEHRGRGLGVELVREMIDNGPYAGSKWLLHTEDAHDLYRRFGFAHPNYKLMERPAPPE